MLLSWIAGSGWGAWCRWEGDDSEAVADDAGGEAGGLGGLSKDATAAVLRESLNGMFRRVTDSLFLSVATCAPLSPSCFLTHTA